MARGDRLSGSLWYGPGEVLALLTPLQELEPGLYLLYALTDEWAILRWLIDDEEAEQILVTDREATLPTKLLTLFMPIGLQISLEGPNRSMH